MMQHLHRRQVYGPRGALISGCLVLTMVVASSAGAQDAPHWESTSEVIDCTSQCHISHHAQGGTLTSSASNVNLCQSCHKVGEMAEDLAIASSDAAVPGAGGSSHAFDVAAVNAAYGAQLPLHSEMALRVMGGNLVCSTCHNQHSSIVGNGGTPRIADAQKVLSIGGGGTLATSGTFTGVAGLWYLVEIVQTGDQSGARFRYSKDNGLSWTPAPGAPCTTADASGCLTASPAGVGLDNGVVLSFADGGGPSFVQGERWEFSASYPFLRAVMDSGDNTAGSDKFCRDCHRDWVMDHDDADGDGIDTRTYDGNPKSHPVGVVLAAAYDRAQPLDGDGQAQNAGFPYDKDGNLSNDLRLDSGGRVQCISCHGVHHADSNTMTSAAR